MIYLLVWDNSIISGFYLLFTFCLSFSKIVTANISEHKIKTLNHLLLKFIRSSISNRNILYINFLLAVYFLAKELFVK